MAEHVRLAAMGKARFGGIQSDPIPTDRAKPMAASRTCSAIDGSSRPAERSGGWGHSLTTTDQILLRQTLENIVVAQPWKVRCLVLKSPENLCLRQAI